MLPYKYPYNKRQEYLKIINFPHLPLFEDKNVPLQAYQNEQIIHSAGG